MIHRKLNLCPPTHDEKAIVTVDPALIVHIWVFKYMSPLGLHRT